MQSRPIHRRGVHRGIFHTLADNAVLVALALGFIAILVAMLSL
jgi:hypothetical protein